MPCRVDRLSQLMRTILPLAFAICLSCRAFAGQANDQEMPDVIKTAKSTVEVFSKYKINTGSCFPDQSARVRLVDEKVLLSDLSLYPNLSADLSEGLVSFKKGQSWGACDRSGRVVIAPQFESLFGFYDGLAAAAQGGKFGFIDRTGHWVIKPAYDARYIGSFVGAACPVQIGGKKAVINRKGDFLWEPGLLIAEVQGGGILIHTPAGQIGFLDHSGSLIPEGKPNHRFHKKGEPTLFESLQVDQRILQQLRSAGW